MTLIIFYKDGDVDVRKCSAISISDNDIKYFRNKATEISLWHEMSTMKKIVVDGVTIWEDDCANR